MIIFEVGQLLILPIAVLTLLYLGCESDSGSSSEEFDDCTAYGETPQFTPDIPDGCADGTIIAREVDECDCQGLPSCVLNLKD